MIGRLLAAVSTFGLACAALGQSGKLEFTSELGRKFYSLPDDKGVVAEARKKSDADPKDVGLLLKLAQAQASVWEEREAVETCTRALAIAPDNADALLERGHRELPLREFDKARADLEKAATLAPKNPEVYYHLALSHYFVGEFDQAGEAFRKAVEFAPNTDSRINSTNWVYASLRRAKNSDAAAKAIAQITPEMKNSAEHTYFYLSLVRFFQGRMPESEALPPEPPAGNSDTETELKFDTVAYGVGNWHLYNGHAGKAREYFERVIKGHVWITWGFVGAERELVRLGGATKRAAVR